MLDALPGVTSVDEVEALLPWRLTPKEVEARYAVMPWPAMARATTAPITEPARAEVNRETPG